jgi:hypothetical protein
VINGAEQCLRLFITAPNWESEDSHSLHCCHRGHRGHRCHSPLSLVAIGPIGALVPLGCHDGLFIYKWQT